MWYCGGGGCGGRVIELGPFPFQAVFDSDRAFVPGSLFTVHLTKLSEQMYTSSRMQYGYVRHKRT